MTKYENIQTAVDSKRVTGTSMYDVKIITVDRGATNFYSLSMEEVNTIYKAFEILNERRWGRTKKTKKDE